MMEEIVIDLLDKTVDEYLDSMALAFGFPSSWGSNIDALIDCLRYIRDSTSRMTAFTIKEQEKVVLVLNNTSKAGFDVDEYVCSVIAHINQYHVTLYGNSAILLDVRDGKLVF